VVDMALVWLLTSPHALAWGLSLSKSIAAEVALLNNFLWNDAWTFRSVAASHDWRSRLIRLVKFNSICAAGIGLSVLLLNAQVYGLGMNVYLANFCAIVVVSIWNFYLSARYGWTTATGSARPAHPKRAALEPRWERVAKEGRP
jgi:dolichol-phosphate mannosyltransferase